MSFNNFCQADLFYFYRVIPFNFLDRPTSTGMYCRKKPLSNICFETTPGDYESVIVLQGSIRKISVFTENFMLICRGCHNLDNITAADDHLAVHETV